MAVSRRLSRGFHGLEVAASLMILILLPGVAFAGQEIMLACQGAETQFVSNSFTSQRQLEKTPGLTAEEVEVLEMGDPQEGLIYVKEICANCHAISGGESPELDATSLVEIANVQGMSAEALLVWLNTLHKKMPNISLEREELADVVAYILSLRTEPDQRKLMAEEVDLGDPEAGLTYAKEACSGCHGVAGEKSPVPEATAFSEVVKVDEMSANALLIWMNVLHPTMPDITPKRDDLMNVIAYIVSQKEKGRPKEQ